MADPSLTPNPYEPHPDRYSYRIQLMTRFDHPVPAAGQPGIAVPN